MDMVDRGLIHIPGGTECDGMNLITLLNDKQLKTYVLFISRIFHFIFSDHSWSNEKAESEAEDKGDDCSHTMTVLWEGILQKIR